MNTAELDRLWRQRAPKIVGAAITTRPAPLGGVYQAPRVIVTLDDGGRRSSSHAIGRGTDGNATLHLHLSRADLGSVLKRV
jgi:hypothetical protein